MGPALFTNSFTNFRSGRLRKLRLYSNFVLSRAFGNAALTFIQRNMRGVLNQAYLKLWVKKLLIRCLRVECTALNTSYEGDNSDGKESPKRQRSLQITTDTLEVSKLLSSFRVKCSYFKIFSVLLNRQYFDPHTIPCKALKFSMASPVTKRSLR